MWREYFSYMLGCWCRSDIYISNEQLDGCHRMLQVHPVHLIEMRNDYDPELATWLWSKYS